MLLCRHLVDVLDDVQHLFIIEPGALKHEIMNMLCVLQIQITVPTVCSDAFISVGSA